MSVLSAGPTTSIPGHCSYPSCISPRWRAKSKCILDQAYHQLHSHVAIWSVVIWFNSPPTPVNVVPVVTTLFTKSFNVWKPISKNVGNVFANRYYINNKPLKPKKSDDKVSLITVTVTVQPLIVAAIGNSLHNFLACPNFMTYCSKTWIALLEACLNSFHFSPAVRRGSTLLHHHRELKTKMTCVTLPQCNLREKQRVKRAVQCSAR